MRLPFLFASLLPATALAEAGKVPEAGGSLLQLFLGLAVVMAMIVGSLWLLKRLAMPRGPGSGLMRVVAGTAVGTRERVVLLEVGSRWLVLGVTPNAVSMLAEVAPQEAPAPSAEPGKDFAGWLKQITERRYGPRR